VRRLLAILLLAAGLSACSPETDNLNLDVRPPDVKVDTPALRRIKARIGMDDCAPGSGTPVADGLPELTLPCLGGGPDVELSTLRGPLIINLWQANCGPCRLEMPALESFHQQYADRVAVLGIDFNDVQPAAALELAEDTSATYPSLADPGGELMAEDAFAIARRGLPAFVLIDEDGAVVAELSGGVESADEGKDLVEEHFGISL